MLILIVVPKRLMLDLRIRGSGIYAKAVVYFIIPIVIRIRAEYRPAYGFILFFGKRKGAVIGRKNRKPPVKLIKTLIVKDITVTGELGIRDMPDKTVIASGILNILLKQAMLAVFGTPPRISITPCFSGNAFALNINCIVSFVLGKLIIEAIKMKRRGNNESSDRKHNAVFNGAHKETCGR